MWRAFEPDGRLTYPDFIETVLRIIPMHWVRLVGAVLFFGGVLILVYNIWMTIRTAPKGFDVEEEVQVPRLARDDAAPGATTAPNTYDHALYRFQHAMRHGFHRILERRWALFTVLTILALSVGSLVEAVPIFLNDDANIPRIASVKPYTPLELLGRDTYIREGCYNCHSQMVRPFHHETERYGEHSKGGEFVYDHPFQWGSKRTGPDLHRVGAKYPHLWHVRHMDEPPSMTPGSVMPPYGFLLEDDLYVGDIEARMKALRTIGVPYTDGEIETAQASIAAQAQAIADEVVEQKGPSGLEGKEITALTAYLQRLGTDIQWRQKKARPLVVPKPEPDAKEEE